MDELPSGIGPVEDHVGEADARVADDLECMQCGYNLRTLPVDGLCPECAAPVRFSREGYYLRNAPVEWLRKLKGGLSLIIVSILVGTLVGIGFVAYYAVQAIQAGPTVAAVPPARETALVALFFVPIGIMLMIGVAKLTAAQPMGDEIAPRRDGTRVWARRALLTYLLMYVAGIALGGLAVAFEDSVGIKSANALLGIASYASSMALLILVVRLLDTLMRRVPRAGIAKYARVVFWGCLITVGPAVVAQAITLASAMSMPTGATTMPAPAATMPVAAMSVSGQGVTTFPASAPALAPAGTTLPSLGFQMLAGCGSCMFLIFALNAFILLFLARGALKQVIMEVERSPDGGAEAGDDDLIGEYGPE